MSDYSPRVASSRPKALAMAQLHPRETITKLRLTMASRRSGQGAKGPTVEGIRRDRNGSRPTERIVMTTKWRALSAEEIGRLSQQGCTCTDWSRVQVAEGFRTDRVRTTHFCEDVRLGVFDKEVSFFGGVTKPTGISHATIHNCTIGDNAFICAVRNYIANYIIEDEAVIDNIDLLAVGGESSFGNGTKGCGVNEAGGREVPIYDRLSAHTAYVLAFYRHRPKVIGRLKAMIDGYTASIRSGMGLVGKGARIINSRLLQHGRY